MTRVGKPEHGDARKSQYEENDAEPAKKFAMESFCDARIIAKRSSDLSVIERPEWGSDALL